MEDGARGGSVPDDEEFLPLRHNSIMIQEREKTVIIGVVSEKAFSCPHHQIHGPRLPGFLAQLRAGKIGAPFMGIGDIDRSEILPKDLPEIIGF